MWPNSSFMESRVYILKWLPSHHHPAYNFPMHDNKSQTILNLDWFSVFLPSSHSCCLSSDALLLQTLGACCHHTHTWALLLRYRHKLGSSHLTRLFKYRLLRNVCPGCPSYGTPSQACLVVVLLWLLPRIHPRRCCASVGGIMVCLPSPVEAYERHKAFYVILWWFTLPGTY